VLAPSPIYLICLGRCAPCASQLAPSRRFSTSCYGATLSYGEIAARVGNPRGSRAVGLANGRNPIAIVVPCHRIIGRDGNGTYLRKR